MKWLIRGLTSSVGLKFLMSLTGMLLVLFLIAHLLGNLQVFLGVSAETGEAALNKYAQKLQGLGALLWVMRLGLLSVFALHVMTGAALWFKNRQARPVGYATYAPMQSTFFSRTMIWTGLLILIFLSYHLLHFTLHVTNPEHVTKIAKDVAAGHSVTGDSAHGHGHTDVYAMVIRGFREPSIALSYVVSMILLGFHLFHGIGSLFQSLGWNHPKYEGFYQMLGKAIATVLVIGNISMPLAVLFGVIGEGVE